MMSNRHKRFAEELLTVRPVTRDLVTSILIDAWPSHAAVVDFGIDSLKHYEALYWPIREAEIMPKALDAALGDGPKLTAMTRQADSNPHKDVAFSTSWDLLLGRNDKTETRANYLSPLDAGDFWRCQGLTPPWEAQAGPDRSAATARDTFKDVLNGKSVEVETTELSKDHGIER